MTTTQGRAERLLQSLDRLGRAVAASGTVGPARAERAGVTVEVDAAGCVVRVEVEAGWQDATPPHRLGATVRDTLETAWSRQLSMTGPTTIPPQPRGRAAHPQIEDLARLGERLDRLVSETEVAAVGPAPAPLTVATAHVSGRYDGRVAVEVDPVWVAGARVPEISAELTTVLRALTRGRDGGA